MILASIVWPPTAPTTLAILASATKSNLSDYAIQCARFFNCELYYEDRSLFLLLDTLKENSLDDRKGFFEYALNFCRLRDKLTYQNTNARYIFCFEDGTEIGNILKDVAVIKRELKTKLKFRSSKEAFHSLKMYTPPNEKITEPSESVLDERLAELQIDNLWIGLNKVG